LNWLASEALRTGLSLELVRDIDTAAMESLKALDPNRPIREADIQGQKVGTEAPVRRAAATFGC